VDAFFVLSGFLITGLLLCERERTGRISLARFWGRRARRLLPALLLVLVAVAALGRDTLAAEELAGLRRDALAALGYVANWRMIYRGGDYFAQTAAASPLQHTWSLGIEEQFYLAWPLLLVFFLRRRFAVLAAAATGALASGVTAALLYRPAADPGRVYYGTDTRASALLIGCALVAILAG
jgi:peptidoglycan/LPS O-acetylase OafA/YrhL